ncbi:hypothetical protein HG15A2_46600 [Adhaeretor mobilis]|uniref:Uncharacterized protein n=1 Tax=Adhaeretor mobilis TaxID=1930276 RepID=A0A517N2T5_9BACT|nr:hypothetical protein HG15A2_46600 [Adhaeretor mobilis]
MRGDGSLDSRRIETTAVAYVTLGQATDVLSCVWVSGSEPATDAEFFAALYISETASAGKEIRHASFISRS